MDDLAVSKECYQNLTGEILHSDVPLQGAVFLRGRISFRTIVDRGVDGNSTYSASFS